MMTRPNFYLVHKIGKVDILNSYLLAYRDVAKNNSLKFASC